MSNPWSKKNPFMSVWLSGANSVAGSLRGHATAQAKRQLATAAKTASKDIFALWTGTPLASPPAKSKKKRRS